MTGIAAELAQLAVRTDRTAIAPPAVDAAKKMVLDTLGVMIAARRAPGIDAVIAQVRDWGGKPEATVLIDGAELPAPHAAFANSALAHALDYDDAHVASALHIMSIVLPAALAAAEMQNATGGDLLDSVILGVETAARLGRAYNLRRSGYQGRGFLPSSVVGGFGAVAAASRLQKLSAGRTVQAFGINYAQAAGNRQALFDKTLTKRLQPAFAVRSALWATALAERGITGPADAIEGDAGLFRVYLGAEPPAVDEVSGAAGIHEIEKVTVKRFPSCGAAHAVTQAALDLAAEHCLRAGDVESVDIYLGGGPNTLVGMPFSLGETPQVNAQFSAAYGAAVALLRGRAGLAEFRDEQVRDDTAVAALAAATGMLTEMEHPPPVRRIDDDWPEHVDWPHVVSVRTRDGQVLQRHCTLRQVLDPQNTTWDQVVAKFRECVEFAEICPAERAEQIIALVESLDSLRRVCDLVCATIMPPE